MKQTWASLFFSPIYSESLSWLLAKLSVQSLTTKIATQGIMRIEVLILVILVPRGSEKEISIEHKFALL